jgi:CBS domain-containing protein
MHFLEEFIPDASKETGKFMVKRSRAIIADIQVRRLPVLNRDKRLVGILSDDVVISRDSKNAGEALRGISRPGGEHTQAE